MKEVHEILEAVELYEGLEHHFRIKFAEEIDKHLKDSVQIQYPFKGTKAQINAFDKGAFLYKESVLHTLFLFKSDMLKS